LIYTLPKKRTDLGKKSIDYIGPKIWQEVPTELKVLSHRTFKQKYKQNFLTKYD